MHIEDEYRNLKKYVLRKIYEINLKVCGKIMRNRSHSSALDSIGLLFMASMVSILKFISPLN